MQQQNPFNNIYKTSHRQEEDICNAYNQQRLVSKICTNFTIQQENDQYPQMGRIYQQANSQKRKPECQVNEKLLYFSIYQENDISQPTD